MNGSTPGSRRGDSNPGPLHYEQGTGSPESGSAPANAQIHDVAPASSACTDSAPGVRSQFVRVIRFYADDSDQVHVAKITYGEGNIALEYANGDSDVISLVELLRAISDTMGVALIDDIGLAA